MVTLQTAGTSNFLFLILMMGLMFFIFWQNIKKQKQEKKFAQELKKGDKVILKSGLHGRIAEISDNTIVIETMAGKLQFERSAVSMDYSKRLQHTEKAK